MNILQIATLKNLNVTKHGIGQACALIMTALGLSYSYLISSENETIIQISAFSDYCKIQLLECNFFLRLEFYTDFQH